MLSNFFARNVGAVLSQKPVSRRYWYLLFMAGAINGISNIDARLVNIGFTARG